jgi:CRISPR-associated protein Cas1
MQTHHNTLYVQTQGAYLGKQGETLRIQVEGQPKLTVPVHHLEGVVCFGRVSVSSAAMELCNERNVSISFLTEQGRFQARVVPVTSGNVLLRREQYRRADRPADCLCIARAIVAAKIQNCRMLLLRSARDCDQPESAEALRHAADRLACSLDTLARADSLDAARGCEGDAARVYFEAFNHMIRQQREAFFMSGRGRRPPEDPLNALLSFLYSVLTHDMAAALEAVGLDPAVGYLHVDRPGRLSLALDLVEEFRPLLCDRLALALINLRQVQADGFTVQPGGAVLMDAPTRKTVLAGLTARKREEVTHPLLEQRVTIGLLPHLQARLMARHIRGDLPEYPALVLK